MSSKVILGQNRKIAKISRAPSMLQILLFPVIKFPRIRPIRTTCISQPIRPVVNRRAAEIDLIAADSYGLHFTGTPRHDSISVSFAQSSIIVARVHFVDDDHTPAKF